MISVSLPAHPSREQLGQALERLAQTQALTQQELAERLDIHRSTISKLFRGQVQKLTHYNSLAELLGTSLEAISTPQGTAMTSASRTPQVDPPRQASVITVAIQKGGSGKTTTVVNLAALWASMGRKVLVIDLDMQGHCALHLGVEDDGEALLRAIQSREKITPIATEWGVDLLAGGSALRALTPHLLASISPLTELKRLVRHYREDYDLILIDTAPSLETATCNALVAADYLLIPVQTETGALDGLATLYEVYEMLAEDHGPLRILGCIPTLHDARTVLHEQMLQTLQQHEHLRPTSQVVRRAIHVAEAFTMRQPLLAYAPKSDSLTTMRQICEELDARLVHDGAVQPIVKSKKTRRSN